VTKLTKEEKDLLNVLFVQNKFYFLYLLLNQKVISEWLKKQSAEVRLNYSSHYRSFFNWLTPTVYPINDPQALSKAIKYGLARARQQDEPEIGSLEHFFESVPAAVLNKQASDMLILCISKLKQYLDQIILEFLQEQSLKYRAEFGFWKWYNDFFDVNKYKEIINQWVEASSFDDNFKETIREFAKNVENKDIIFDYLRQKTTPRAKRIHYKRSDNNQENIKQTNKRLINTIQSILFDKKKKRPIKIGPQQKAALLEKQQKFFLETISQQLYFREDPSLKLECSMIFANRDNWVKENNTHISLNIYAVKIGENYYVHAKEGAKLEQISVNEYKQLEKAINTVLSSVKAQALNKKTEDLADLVAIETGRRPVMVATLNTNHCIKKSKAKKFLWWSEAEYKPEVNIDELQIDVNCKDLVINTTIPRTNEAKKLAAPNGFAVRKQSLLNGSLKDILAKPKQELVGMADEEFEHKSKELQVREAEINQKIGDKPTKITNFRKSFLMSEEEIQKTIMNKVKKYQADLDAKTEIEVKQKTTVLTAEYRSSLPEHEGRDKALIPQTIRDEIAKYKADLDEKTTELSAKYKSDLSKTLGKHKKIKANIIESDVTDATEKFTFNIWRLDNVVWNFKASLKKGLSSQDYGLLQELNAIFDANIDVSLMFKVHTLVIRNDGHECWLDLTVEHQELLEKYFAQITNLLKELRVWQQKHEVSTGKKLLCDFTDFIRKGHGLFHKQVQLDNNLGPIIDVLDEYIQQVQTQESWSQEFLLEHQIQKEKLRVVQAKIAEKQAQKSIFLKNKQVVLPMSIKHSGSTEEIPVPNTLRK